jgi:hypothetical protein
MEMHASWAARPSNGSEMHKMTKTIRMARAKLMRKRMPLLIREASMPVDGKLLLEEVEGGGGKEGGGGGHERAAVKQRGRS